MACGSKSAKNLGQSSPGGEDSSESDGETEPAKSFHRRLSTNREIKCSVCFEWQFLSKKLVYVCRLEEDGMRAFVYFDSGLSRRGAPVQKLGYRFWLQDFDYYIGNDDGLRQSMMYVEMLCLMLIFLLINLCAV